MHLCAETRPGWHCCWHRTLPHHHHHHHHPQISALLGQMQRCGGAFHALVSLSKVHQTRNGLLAAAVKQGGAFVDVLLRGLPLWRAVSGAGYEQQFERLVKEVQKGTRMMQVRRVRVRGCACSPGRRRVRGCVGMLHA